MKVYKEKAAAQRRMMMGNYLIHRHLDKEILKPKISSELKHMKM